MKIFPTLQKEQTAHKLRWLRTYNYDIRILDDLTFEVYDQITGNSVEVHKKLAEVIETAYAKLTQNEYEVV
jgi:hypothetical protein